MWVTGTMVWGLLWTVVLVPVGAIGVWLKSNVPFRYSYAEILGLGFRNVIGWVFFPIYFVGGPNSELGGLCQWSKYPQLIGPWRLLFTSKMHWVDTCQEVKYVIKFPYLGVLRGSLGNKKISRMYEGLSPRVVRSSYRSWKTQSNYLSIFLLVFCKSILFIS